jgi:hypothetical protein
VDDLLNLPGNVLGGGNKKGGGGGGGGGAGGGGGVNDVVNNTGQAAQDLLDFLFGN